MSALASYLVGIGWNSQEASFVGVTQADGLTATGNSSQANGYAITATVNNFTTVAAGANSARLPAIVQHKHAWILIANNDAADTLLLYPASGESIMSLGTNNPISVTINAPRLLFPISSTKWVAI